jgi:cell wall-associated NlpC family hydrolase
VPPNPRPLAILALGAAVLCLPPTAAATIARHHARTAHRHAHAGGHHKDKTTDAARGPLDGGTLYAGSPRRSTGTTDTTPVRASTGGTIAGEVGGATGATGTTGVAGPTGPNGTAGTGGTAGGTVAATGATGGAGSTGAPSGSGSLALILPDGLAQAPLDAPAAVKQAIAAGNQLIGEPYLYGGGHASFSSSGYDCSGAVSYALHGADLLASPLDSSALELWGVSGAGQWITVYANPRHTYVDIAGIRLDTSRAGDAGGQTGPRWRALLSTHTGYVARHPTGL